MKPVLNLLTALAVAFVTMFVAKSANAQNFREVPCDGGGLCLLIDDHVPADTIVRMYDGVYRKALADVGELEEGEHLTFDKIYRTDGNSAKLIPVCLDERGLAKRIGQRGDESVWRNCDRPTWVPVPKMRIKIPTQQIPSYETTKAFYQDVRRCLKGDCSIDKVKALLGAKAPQGTPKVDPPADLSAEIAKLNAQISDLKSSNNELIDERDKARSELEESKRTGMTGEVNRLKSALWNRETELYAAVGANVVQALALLFVFIFTVPGLRRRIVKLKKELKDALAPKPIAAMLGGFREEAAQKLALKEATTKAFDPSKTTKKNLPPPGAKTIAEQHVALVREEAAKRREAGNGLNRTITIDDEPAKAPAPNANEAFNAKIADLEKRLAEADAQSAKNGTELTRLEAELQAERVALEAAQQSVSLAGKALATAEQSLAALSLSAGINETKLSELRVAWHDQARAALAAKNGAKEDPLSKIGRKDDPTLGGRHHGDPPLPLEVASANLFKALAVAINEGITPERVATSLKEWSGSDGSAPQSGPFEADHVATLDEGARLSQPNLPVGMTTDDEKTAIFNVAELQSAVEKELAEPPLTEEQLAAKRRATQGFESKSWAADPAVADPLRRLRDAVPARSPHVLVGDPNNRPVRSSTDRPPTEPSVGNNHLDPRKGDTRPPPPPSLTTDGKN